jgi:uncharacterized membrane protein
MLEQFLYVFLTLIAIYALARLLPNNLASRLAFLYAGVNPHAGEKKSHYFMRRGLFWLCWAIVFWVATQLWYYASEYFAEVLNRNLIEGFVDLVMQLLTGVSAVNAFVSMMISASERLFSKNQRFNPDQHMFTDMN